MSAKPDETNITTCVSKDTRDRLEHRAGLEGLSLSRYVSRMLTQSVTDQPATIRTVNVRNAREQHGSLAVTIPPNVCAHMGISPGTPLAFATIPGGALLNTVR